MSQYWDCSMDTFYEVADTGEDSSSSSSSSDSDTEMSNSDQTPSEKLPSCSSFDTSQPPRTRQVYKGRRLSTGSAMPSVHRDETVSALVECVAWAFNCQVRSPNLPPRLQVRNLLFPVRQSFVVGRVPRDRELGRRAILEGPVMGICCRAETNFRPNEKIGNGKADGSNGCNMKFSEGVNEWRDILDLAREVGVMLLLAQERAREAKQEVKPGEGKWWTTTPRWGGGPGGLMESEVLAAERDAVDKEKMATPPTSENALEGGSVDETAVKPSTAEILFPEIAKPPSVRPKRKAMRDASDDIDRGSVQHKKGSRPTPAEKWKIVRPGPGTWDAKIKYMSIGAPKPQSRAEPSPPSPAPAQEAAKSQERPQAEPPTARGETAPQKPAETHDHIFMVSSINHHVALLAMPVSTPYLAWLAGAEQRDAAGQQHGLQLKRTRWFDLFDEADRVHFVQGLWDVMAWLTRE